MTRKATTLILLLFTLAGCATLNDEGVRTLLDVRSDEGEKEKALVVEEKRFQVIKRAVDSEYFKRGQSAKEIRRRFGEPMIVIEENKGERWGYKSRKSNWLSGPRIYLVFDENARLAHCEVY
jgi:hypothetical protein